MGSDDRREQEEGETGGEEHVADRGDVLDERDRDRQDVGEWPRVEQEVERPGPAARRTWNGVRSAVVKPAETRLGSQIGMWPQVRDDRDRVQEDADERDPQARLAPVDPERREEHSERRDEQRKPQGVDDLVAPDQEVLGPESEDDREKQDADPAQPDRGEVAERAAREQAEDEAGDDAGDQHRATVTVESGREVIGVE